MKEDDSAIATRKGVGPSQQAPGRLSRRGKRVLSAGTILLGVFVLLILRFGGFVLVAPDPLPHHADVAIALHGSYEGSKARADEVIRLLEEGRVDFAMLSVGAVTSWGEWLPDVVRRYLRATYSPEISDRIVICEVLADSTVEEAAALKRCLGSHDWSSLIVVTSNYHTRRTRWIWEDSLAAVDPPFAMSVWGVADGTYEASGWWRRRRYAKTWLLEIAKLAWYPIEDIFGS